jgi:hypothetical protein
MKRRDFGTLLGGMAAANSPRSRRFSKPTRGWRHFKLCGCRKPSAVKPDADAVYTSGRPARTDRNSLSTSDVGTPTFSAASLIACWTLLIDRTYRCQSKLLNR